MKINNVSSKTSLKGVSASYTVLLIYLVVFILFYAFTSQSYSSVFEWANAMFQMYLNISDMELKVGLGALIFGAPPLLIAALINDSMTRKNNIKSFNNEPNIKYINFLPDRIHFCFTSPQYDFTCGYEDIEKFSMKLKTVEVYTKYDVIIALSEIQLTFQTLNGKEFTLYNTPLKPTEFIYKIIDYARKMPNFSYRFCGAGVNEDLKEKIEDYIKTGYKQILSTPQEEKFKYLSLLFFMILIVTTCPFVNHFIEAVENKEYMIFIACFPALILIVITAIINVLLIIDKINERKFHIKHPANNLIGKIPCELIAAVQFITVCVLAFMIFKPLILSISDIKILNITKGFQQLNINPLSELDYMSKQEIYNQRKYYVQNSIFASKDYEPNERVFGSIQSNKPWWGSIECSPVNYSADYHENIEGESKQSLQINNPNVLIGLASVYIIRDVEKNAPFCHSEYSRFIPKSLKYNKKDNIIIAEYDVEDSFLTTYVTISNRSHYYPLQLSGLNALDFGYKYVYAFNTKNIKMHHKNNITKEIGTFSDYIHLGGSCQYKDGCNNVSPMQNDKMITIRDLPAEINLKLWKKQPHNKYLTPADMYYRIIFK